MKRINFIKLFFLFSLLSAISGCSKDPILYPYEAVVAYDYRDSLIGNYYCNVDWLSSGPWGSSTGSYIDTLIVSDANVDEMVINISSSTFKLDSVLSFDVPPYPPQIIYRGQFYPSNDSIYVYTRIGGMGGGVHSLYKGKKQ